ncbi:MAG TPA: IclR family transcriptional regulator [Armatimonadaceae bacterium]|nr:IclR family transcriptional regulator [Armatimonadaceae bacterium]
MEAISTIGTVVSDEGAGGVPAVERALDILELLETSDGRPTLTEIAGRLGVPKGSAHRLLATLAARGYIAARGDGSLRGGFTLGPRLLTLAARAEGRVDLVDAARGPLERLAARTGEGAQLSVRAGDRAVVLLRVPSPSHPEVALMGGAGASFPLHAVAVGKALLAFAPPAERAVYLAGELAAFTDRTIAEPGALERELAAIRDRGVARDEQEYKRGLRAFAAPVFGADGRVAAAVAVPLLVGGPESDDFVLEALRASAADISLSLGFTSPRSPRYGEGDGGGD